MPSHQRVLLILAGVVSLSLALTACALNDPGQSSQGSWYRNVHTDPGGTPDAPAGSHSRQIMERPAGQSSAGSGQQGTWSGNVHKDAGGAPDAPAASHRREIYERQPQASQARRVPNDDFAYPRY